MIRPPVLIFVLLSAVLAFADDRLAGAPPNSPKHRDTPYVLLIGLDGFRWDFAEKFGAKNLLAFRDRGSSAAGLLPSFPTTTFPNYYTMVTGLRPDRHGMVSMQFFDPALGERFLYRTDGRQGRWFEGAIPLWQLVEREGMRTASYFWVGSDADIHGRYPTAWFGYDGSVTHEERVSKVLQWLRLPEERRPHLVTLYFADVDTAGHRTGTESAETRRAVLQIDETLGVLFRELESVRPAVNVIVVSDHGLVQMERVVDLSDRADFSGITVVNTTTMVKLYSRNKARLREVERSLRAKNDGSYAVYRREKMPAHLHSRTNPRNGDLIVLTTGTHGITIRPSEDEAKRFSAIRLPVGNHGYDVRRVPEMKGILYAAGPSIKAGVRLGDVENPGVFGLVARLLGVPVPPGADPGRELVRKLLR